jgi:hypothetical protein
VSKLTKAGTRLTFIRDVFGSNLGYESNYPTEVLRDFP